MQTFYQPLYGYEEFNELQNAIKKKKLPVQVTGCIDSQKCHLMFAASQEAVKRLIITYNDLRAKEIYEDCKLYNREVYLYPAKDIIFFSGDIRGNAIVRERIKILRRLMEGENVTVIATIDGGMDKLLPLEYMKENSIHIKDGQTIDLEKLSVRLVELGYERQVQVESAGEFAIRGGIIDVFPLTEEAPVRMELWGDEVDSIRSFDVESQRSIENLDEICLYPAAEIILSEEIKAKGLAAIDAELEKNYKLLRDEMKTEEAARLRHAVEEFKENLAYCQGRVGLDSYVNYFFDRTVSFFDYFRVDDAVIFLDEPARIMEKGETVLTEFSESMTSRAQKGYILPGQMDVVFDYRALIAGVMTANTVLLSMLDAKVEKSAVKAKFNLSVRSVNPYNNNFELLVKDLKAWKRNGYRVVLLSGSRTRAERLAADLRDHELTAFFSDDRNRLVQNGEILVTQGNVHRGFEYPLVKFVVISESDIFGATVQKKKKKVRAYEGSRISSFSDLNIGDYVVHENHGLGIYRGIEKITVDKVTKDYIKIEYAGGGNLYILATSLDVIQKYAGADARKPKLNKLNSTEWKTTKARVRTAVKNIAGELVQLYAMRQAQKGYPFSPDDVWQREFEELFPYEETDDQLRAIEETKRDMESTNIMDRLVCGDVGYGKTEIAIRAAFKAVLDKKQVVFLVPTTILAQQHYNTFTQRMKDFAVNIEMLSRFRTPAEQKKIIAQVQKGEVDILIGTHRVLSKDLKYKDLGLLIVDEEQRFGVADKEKIKQIKGNVDVLTLTATPIPRTLHMSLAGIRDMSVLEEPPVDRMPIQTFVMEHNDEMIREAIHREMARGGQVYYVYNRVNGIDEIAVQVRRLVPEANVAFAHGQMSERQLEKIMFEFINGEIDVLISTTIIETGLDISNVNTMIIDDADRLGLSQLYQLRGRVGRSNRTAYAFLMYKRDKMLKEVAEKRLQAIKEFTELGSGFKIAMRDLEIRGAGNLLGAEQSGHMEAVGYDMYCKMLNEAVRSMQNGGTLEESYETSVDIPLDAYIPATYIRNEMQKLDMYKRVAGIETIEELEDLQAEFIDRFGEPPKPVLNLLQVALLKAQAHAAYLVSLEQKGELLVMKPFVHAEYEVNRIPELLESFPGLKFKQNALVFEYDLPRIPRKNGVPTMAEGERTLSAAQKLVAGFRSIVRKTLPCILMMLLVMLGTAGCGTDETKQPSAPTPYPTGITQQVADKLPQQDLFVQTLLRVGNVGVSYGEAVLYMQSAKEETETLYGKDIWNYVLNKEGVTYAKLRKEQLLEEIIYTKLVCAQAESLGISLTEDEYMDVKEYTDVFMAGFTEESRKSYGVNEEMVKKIYADNLLATKIYEALTLNIDTDVSDEEARHGVFWYLFIAKFGIDEDGKHYELDDNALEKVRARASALAQEAQATTDFYGFASKNTDDTDEIEIVVGRGEMLDELDSVAFSLKQDETSGLIETKNGYFILHCAEYQNEEATDRAKVDIILERQESAFKKQYAVWEENTPVWVDPVLWKRISLAEEN